jgi:hypothetical protein
MRQEKGEAEALGEGAGDPLSALDEGEGAGEAEGDS